MGNFIQEQIADKLRTYEGAEKDRLQSFRSAVKKKINQKQNEYDTLMKNLSAAVLPAEVIQDISGKMQTLKEEIQQLQNAEPPTDYTTQTVKNWLNSIKAAPDKKAVHLFIERIDTRQTENKTDYNVKTTLQSVLEILEKVSRFDRMRSGGVRFAGGAK